ncbi:MAG: ferredoxin [Acidimicrobiia bacterium]
MKKLVINADICEGHGRCYEIAPSLVDSDDRGRGTVIAAEISDDQLAEAQEAVRACPEQAISIVEA